MPGNNKKKLAVFQEQIQQLVPIMHHTEIHGCEFWKPPNHASWMDGLWLQMLLLWLMIQSTDYHYYFCCCYCNYSVIQIAFSGGFLTIFTAVDTFRLQHCPSSCCLFSHNHPLCFSEGEPCAMAMERSILAATAETFRQMQCATSDIVSFLGVQPKWWNREVNLLRQTYGMYCEMDALVFERWGWRPQTWNDNNNVGHISFSGAILKEVWY